MNVNPSPLNSLDAFTARIARFSVAWWRVILAGLIAYQVVIYGWVSRAYMHVSVVLFPWLINQPEYLLYDNININYAPGYLWLNAVFSRLIPDDPLRLRLGTILIAAAITILVFVQARRWWNVQIGLLAAALYALWGPLLLDYLLYFEFFLGLLALSALMIWQNYPSSWWRPFVVGLLVGCMPIIKQPAVAVAGVFFLWRILGRDWKIMWRDLAWFACGVMIPLALTAGILAGQGVLSRAFYLMINYNTPFAALGIQLPAVQEVVILVVWLALVPYFVYSVWKRQILSGKEVVLFIGLTLAMLVFVYPRYGRFHLSGAVPFVALMSAGAVYSIARMEPSRWLTWHRAYGYAAVAALLVVGAVLPAYYRVKLGAGTSQYDALIPVSQWVTRETGAPPGTRVWILPDIDPTGNFYPISGYLPPAFYTNMYPWFFVNSNLAGQIIAGLESDPPAYIVMVDQWQDQVQVIEGLIDHLRQHYTPFTEMEFPGELGHLTLYQRSG